MIKYKQLFDYPYEYLHSNIGIYKITFQNSQKEKCYIGSALATKSNSKDERGFYARWKGHIYSLRNNKGCPILQKAYNKYGEDNIKFEIIDILKEGYDKNYYNQIETGYISKYKAYSKGYNTLPKGGTTLGKIVNEETRLKISLKNKGENNGNYGLLGKYHMSSKPVYQYSLNGEFIQKWDSKADVERELKIHSANIRRACRKNLTAGGFKWSTEGLKSEFNCNIK